LPEVLTNTTTPKSQKKVLKIALIGNPNSGKSTIFNALTGLNQKTANFPGVTVDKKTGYCSLNSDQQELKAEIIDLPGTYSLYPKSLDEQVTFQAIFDFANSEENYIAIVVADATNLKRSLFLCSQVIDLKVPVVLALNMMDLVEKQNLKINLQILEANLGIKVVPVNARKKEGIKELKKAISTVINSPDTSFLKTPETNAGFVKEVKEKLKLKSEYAAFIAAHNSSSLKICNTKQILFKEFKTTEAENARIQSQETLNRYSLIRQILKESLIEGPQRPLDHLTQKVDKILTHKIYGYVIFLAILFVMFQAIFTWSSYPMDLIEWCFVNLSSWLSNILPQGILADLLINGVLAGLSGIVVFVPQIAMLFAFIAILEDTGYMARVSFIMDKLMRKFGLNGKSVIPLIGGIACAVPAIMTARTISNWKERMTTIMVTPLMSCSARLPVYTLLISLAVPSESWYGFNLQGIALMSLYLLGFFAAIATAWIMRFILKTKEKSYFIMELPIYRMPRWSSVGFSIMEKVKIFLFDAGKVIIAVSIILWVLSSYAPGDTFKKLDEKYEALKIEKTIEEKELMTQYNSEKLQNSYAGIIGKTIEPVIAPLGFDWKIGIALLTSFAAREVFVGTMATIYSVNEDEKNLSIREKMSNEINPKTGEKMFNPALGFSLLLFYVFAMQCMSTLAVVYRETRSFKWPVVQFLYMSALAYISSFLAYQFLS